MQAPQYLWHVALKVFADGSWKNKALRLYDIDDAGILPPDWKCNNCGHIYLSEKPSVALGLAMRYRVPDIHRKGSFVLYKINTSKIPRELLPGLTMSDKYYLTLREWIIPRVTNCALEESYEIDFKNFDGDSTLIQWRKSERLIYGEINPRKEERAMECMKAMRDDIISQINGEDTEPVLDSPGMRDPNLRL